MDRNFETSWTLIRSASTGEQQAREEFARRYAAVVRAYISVRWSASDLRQESEDALHEVLMECLKEGGVLARADPDRPGGFRLFLIGAVRMVARRFEQRAAQQGLVRDLGESELDHFSGKEVSASKAFDLAWARSMAREAAALLAARAQVKDERAARRVDLLRLRFYEGLPIREIAKRWNVESALLHREYAMVRKEFEECLKEVLTLEHGNDGVPPDNLVNQLQAILN